MVDPMRPEFAAEAGTLVSAKWKRCVHQSIRVNPDGARLQTARDAVRTLHVAGPDGSGETIRIRIGLLNDLIDVLKREDGKHRTKDFLTRDLHIVLHVAENCGLQKKPYASVT